MTNYKIQYLCECVLGENQSDQKTLLSPLCGANDLASPLAALYFCSSCQRLRCPTCVEVTHESFYCPSCFENMLSSQVYSNGNRCHKCPQCPECLTKLGFFLDQKGFVYLMCPFCGWDSIHFNIQATHTSEYLMAISQQQTKQDKSVMISTLVQHFQEQKNQAKKETDPFSKNLSLPSLKTVEETEKIVNERISNLSFAAKQKLKSTGPLSKVEELVSGDNHQQEESRNEFKLEWTPILTKKSKKCPQCKAFLVKPKTIDPHSADLEVCHTAVKIVPRVCVIQATQSQSEHKATLRIFNPTPHHQKIRLSFSKHFSLNSQNNSNNTQNEQQEIRTWIGGQSEKRPVLAQKKTSQEEEEEEDARVKQRGFNSVDLEVAWTTHVTAQSSPITAVPMRLILESHPHPFSVTFFVIWE